ncbi:hypothetical protein [Sporomusa aerivorans]|uniref:hypothetical protein n=1 Tax=Sporomusa aerivorans TaxID=204936 RepID=UPI00352AB23D
MLKKPLILAILLGGLLLLGWMAKLSFFPTVAPDNLPGAGSGTGQIPPGNLTMDRKPSRRRRFRKRLRKNRWERSVILLISR